MLRSMTGFGRGEGRAKGCSVICEIKSVNGKYLDINPKLPKSFLAFEPEIKEILNANEVFRGKVDVWFEVVYDESSGARVKADIALAKQYKAALEAIAKELGIKEKIRLAEIAFRPDVLSVEENDLEYDSFANAARAALKNAAKQLVAMRGFEGENLYRNISERLSLCEKLTEEVDSLSEKSKNGYFSKLEERLKKVLADNRVTPDEARLLTECAIFADKVSVDEETVRLRAHIEAFRSIVSDEHACGRRLDFLVQEMNREANTIGSKCSDSTVAHKVVELKNEIEKIREQIQNLE